MSWRAGEEVVGESSTWVVGVGEVVEGGIWATKSWAENGRPSRRVVGRGWGSTKSDGRGFFIYLFIGDMAKLATG